jgi:hypothetical protein
MCSGFEVGLVLTEVRFGDHDESGSVNAERKDYAGITSQNTSIQTAVIITIYTNSL